MDNFERELERLINKYSRENDSDTPDFILAEYISGCLDNFSNAVRKREKWYGREPEVVSGEVYSGSAEEPPQGVSESE